MFNFNSESFVFQLPSKNIKSKLHRTIVLPVFLLRETSLLTITEKHRVRAFENRALRRIIGLKREEVTGGWRKLHSVSLYHMLLG
jgi:hypothetical protein